MDQGEGAGPQAQTAYAHPTAVFFHVAFKVAALVWFLFCELLVSSFVVNFVICIIILALDFWTVKNISGRLLVGLRWWNEVAEDGSSEWQFESLGEGQRSINSADKGVFWLSLYAMPVVWAAMVILEIVKIRLDYLLVAIVGFCLAGANLYGYYKCSKEQKRKMEEMARGYMSQGIMSAINRFM
mmetsp:Transcript_37309/g.66793  ORF Transcript_37309/g.66793 Transcript_37309/m.66793 type:complete len:184 (-) Transcript_37309:272-823(-)